MNKSTLLDEISSINSECCFSPVEPDVSLVEPDLLIVKSSLAKAPINGSIETISSINTIARPSLLDDLNDSVGNMDEHNVQISEMSVIPYCKLNDRPFHLFSEIQLDLSTNGYLNLGSRSAAYYGQYPYTYSGITHASRPFTDNVYLMHVLSYIKIVMPDIVFNSAMIHRYNDGNSIIPHHSDNEACIENDSQIVTISLGETRDMEFKNKLSGTTKLVTLVHGEVFTMSKSSQHYYSHAIPATEVNKNTRLSITLRQIKPVPSHTNSHRDNDNILPSAINTCPGENTTLHQTPDGYQDEQYSRYPFLETQQPSHSNPVLNHAVTKPLTDTRQRSQFSWYREGWQPPPNRVPSPVPLPSIPHPQRHTPKRTVLERPLLPREQFIFPPEQLHSSRSTTQHPPRKAKPHRYSQFRPFPKENKDEVIFISSSMFADLDSQKLTTNKVKSHVFFYRGADSCRMLQKLKADPEFQGLNKCKVSKVFLLTGTNNVDSVGNQRQNIHDCYNNISEIIDYVCSFFPSAAVNVVNILPRVQENRRNVIRQLNDHIKDYCQRSNNKLNFIDTYSTNLFTLPNGARKSELFKYTFRNDIDNVHLNNYGIVKLGRQLKYLAHL